MQERYITRPPRRRQHAPLVFYWMLVFPAVLTLIAGIIIGYYLAPQAKAAQEPTETLPSAINTYESSKDTAEPISAVQSVYEPMRYELTEDERITVEQVVAAEAIGEPYDGQMAVAECILNACEKDGIRPLKVIDKYKYAKSRKDPTESVKEAVGAVFDRGETITDGQILYFYAPGRTKSNWHESQEFVTEIGGHRFFEEA